MKADSLTLQGRDVRLEPLSFAHAEALVHAASDGELWNLPYTIVPSATTVHEYLEKIFNAQEEGREHPFVIVNHATQEIVGTTRYMNIDLLHRRREIGGTWLARSAQRTAINTEAKFLLLRHAFEECRCIRVEFMTDVLNEQSRTAIARIGATQEGILRNHLIMPGGRYRDSVCFSIVEAEWPSVKANLIERLASVRP